MNYEEMRAAQDSAWHDCEREVKTSQFQMPPRNVFDIGFREGVKAPRETRLSPIIQVRRDQHFNPAEHPSGTVVIFI